MMFVKKELMIAIILLILISGCAEKKEREDCIRGCLPTFEKEVVWAEFVDGDLLENIYFLDIKTGTKSIVNSQPAHISGLDKYGDKVVWIDNRKSFGYENHTMYMKDLSTGEETELIPVPSGPSRIKFYKDKIVFVVQERERIAMYMYDLNTGIKTELIANLAPRSGGYAARGSFCLDMYENKVVFKDYTGMPTIYLLDLDTKTKTKILEEGYGRAGGPVVGKNCPSIYKNKVIYGVESGEFSTAKILLYNIDTGSTTEIAKIEKPSKWGKITDISVSNLRIHEDEVKYRESVGTLSGPDMYATSSKCFLVDINSKEKTDITCKGGIPEYTYEEDIAIS